MLFAIIPLHKRGGLYTNLVNYLPILVLSLLPPGKIEGENNNEGGANRKAQKGRVKEEGAQCHDLLVFGFPYLRR